MEAKDGSLGFDFAGIYDEVKTNELINYTIGDGRKVEVRFIQNSDSTKIILKFEAESKNSIKMQHDGWMSILNNFNRNNN